MSPLGLETIAGEALEDRREPRARTDEEMEGHAGAASSSQAGHKPCTVEALSPLGSLASKGALQAKDPGHIEGPKTDSAPGREAGEDAEEGHAAQVCELPVACSKTSSVADETSKSS